MRVQTSKTGKALTWGKPVDATVQLDGNLLTWTSETAQRSYILRPAVTVRRSRSRKTHIYLATETLFHLRLICRSAPQAAAWLQLLAAVAGADPSSSTPELPGRYAPGARSSFFECSPGGSWVLQHTLALLRDFAGQVVYYDTHKWFLSRRSLLILAVNLCKAGEPQAQQRICWWLRTIRAWTRGESQVVLVGTHADKLASKEKCDAAQATLMKAVHDAFGSDIVVDDRVFAVSSHTLDNIDQLAERLQQLLVAPDSQTLVGTVQPQSYFELEAVVCACTSSTPMVTRRTCANGAAQKRQRWRIRRICPPWRRCNAGRGRQRLRRRPALRARPRHGLVVRGHPGLGTVRVRGPPLAHEALRADRDAKAQGQAHFARRGRVARAHAAGAAAPGAAAGAVEATRWCGRRSDPHPVQADEAALRALGGLEPLVVLLCHFGILQDVTWASAASRRSAGLVSPKGNGVVFVPCMLEPVYGTEGFDPQWEAWYMRPLPGQRVMGVRIDIAQPHYTSIALMPEILRALLPHTALAAKPNLRSDGLMLQANEAGGGGGLMTMMLFMRPCADKVFRVDLAVRQPWVSVVDDGGDPLRAMSAQLETFVRAVRNALPEDVRPGCWCMVLSPAMLERNGLEINVRGDIGWPFENIRASRESRQSLTCPRTGKQVDYRELSGNLAFDNKDGGDENEGGGDKNEGGGDKNKDGDNRAGDAAAWLWPRLPRVQRSERLPPGSGAWSATVARTLAGRRWARRHRHSSSVCTTIGPPLHVLVAPAAVRC